MQWILNLRTFELIIHYNIIVEKIIDWINDQIVYKHLQFIMKQLRKMIHNIIEIVTKQLFQELMFVHDAANILKISWSLLRDDFINSERQ